MTNGFREPTKEDSYEAYLRQAQNLNQAEAKKVQDIESGLIPTPTPQIDPLTYKFPTASLNKSSDEPSSYGRMLAEDERVMEEESEEEDTGIGGAIMDTVSYLASPLMAVGQAALAPAAVGTTDLKSTLKVANHAFWEAMLPEYGKDLPEYGKLAARRLGVDDKWGLAIEMVTDPTIIMGLGATKVFQRGLRSAAKSKRGTTMLNKAGGEADVPVRLGEFDDAGPWRRGLEELLGASRPAAAKTAAAGRTLDDAATEQVADDFLRELDAAEEARPTRVVEDSVVPKEGEVGPAKPERAEVEGPGKPEYTDTAGSKYTRADAIELAKRADLGDREALGTITKAIDKSPAALRYAERMDATDSDAMLRGLEEKFGSHGGTRDIDLDGNVEIAKDLLKESLNTNVKTLGGKRLNLSKSVSDEGGNNIVNRLEEIFSDQFDEMAKELSNDDTILASQRVQLADIMGMKVAEMGPKEAYVLRQTLIASADNLQAAAIRATDDMAQELDEIAFDKALAFHTFIQHKAKGAATHAGRLLQSYNIVAKSTNGRIAEINALLGGTKLC